MYKLLRKITLDKCTSPIIQEERKKMKYYVLRSDNAPQLYKGRYVPKQIKFKSKDAPNDNMIKEIAIKYIGDLPCILQEFQMYDYNDFYYPKEVDISNGI